MNYYNEFDPKAAAWLRQLISEGLIPKGDVDERSIADVQPHELSKYTQCHFFAGIGGWSVALELAGWDASRPVWTGSCPCQPFSSAGKGLGTADERHLWPVFAKLINACKPPVVFGEQVASKAGRAWLGGVFADLEAMAYRRAGADLCAAGVGADHIRQRLYWVADATSGGREVALLDSSSSRPTSGVGEASLVGSGSAHHGLEHAENLGPAHRDVGSGREGEDPSTCRRGIEIGARRSRNAWSDASGRLGDPRCERDERWRETGDLGHPPSEEQSEAQQREWGRDANSHSSSNNFWSDARPILCRDGKYRRVPTEPALFPLADGLPFKLDGRGSSRPAILKGSGNAIVPPLAAEFIKAYLDTLNP